MFENSLTKEYRKRSRRCAAPAAGCSSPPRRTRRTRGRVLEHFEMAEFFQGIYGAQNDGGRAIKSELLRFVLRSEGFDAAAGNIVMIGDRKFDVLGA